MSEERYAVARLDEIERVRGGRLRPIRAHFGMGVLGVTAWTAGPGEPVVNDHDEKDSGQQELYFVLTGRATFTVEGGEVDAPAGTFVFVGDAAVQRKAIAAEPDTTVLALGAKQGEAYRGLGWEWSQDAFPLFGEERYEEAYEFLSRAAERHPEAANVLYNLACAEARIGKKDEAVEHLTRAIELYEGFTEIAKDDPDLEPIRDHPSLALT